MPDATLLPALLLTAVGASSCFVIACSGRGERVEMPSRPALHVATGIPGREEEAKPHGPVLATPRLGLGVACWNGSVTDCNVKGTTLGPESAWVDPSPPDGWVQCAGFVNTAGDDVAPNFLDLCLGTTALRLIVFDADGKLEEDLSLTGMPKLDAWPDFNYLAGEPRIYRKTRWGATLFFTVAKGKDACMQTAAPSGVTFGSGSALSPVVAGGNLGADEYRINCGGASLPGRKIGLYRDGRSPSGR